MDDLRDSEDTHLLTIFEVLYLLIPGSIVVSGAWGKESSCVHCCIFSGVYMSLFVSYCSQHSSLQLCESLSKLLNELHR